MSVTRQAAGILMLASTAFSQSIIDHLSFGQHHQITFNDRSIPNWQLSSVNHGIVLMSDRAILTPPVPGKARGGMWSEHTPDTSAWSAEFEFRASGQESGTGDIQFWYTKDKDRIGSESVYNAPNFDGLSLVIDQYGGHGGSIRGFLNDGSKDFRQQPNLEALAFGHCDYAYRNLGRPSKIRVSNTNGFSVTVDDRPCFSTTKLNLPSGYHFGLTSTTGENPDSFEVFKFIVSNEPTSSNSGPVHGNTDTDSNNNDNNNNDNFHPSLQRLDRLPGAPEIMPDVDASEIASEKDQFADLHDRIQGLTHLIANVFVEFGTLSGDLEARFDGVEQRLQSLNEVASAAVQGSGAQQASNTAASSAVTVDMIAKMDRITQKMENLERVLMIVQREVEGKDYREHLVQLERAVDRVSGGLGEHLAERVGHLIHRSAPRMGLFVFIILAVQIMLAGAYIVYKRRRNNMPKKFL